MDEAPAILFTAFEPSGDALAAALIGELRRRGVAKIYALGGAKMAAAGAEMIERTTDDAVMGVPPLRKVVEHRALLKRLRGWMSEHRLSAVIPTDSPAANWSVCQATRDLHPQAKIIHLAAPQLWAWASWRIHRMRRLSDHALCLLPFEPDWFGERGVSGTFVGHPIFDELSTSTGLADPVAGDGVRLAVLPGSRGSEVERNLPTMLEAVGRLRAEGVQISGPVIAASDERRAAQIETLASQEAHDIRVGCVDDVLAWSEVVLAASGTVTLQVAAHRKPMVVMYNASRLLWHGLGRWIVATQTFTLPNLIGQWLNLPGGRRVPELVPHFGAVEPVVDALEPLMVEGEARLRQRELFEAIHGTYAPVRFADAAADRVMSLLGSADAGGERSDG